MKSVNKKIDPKNLIRVSQPVVDFVVENKITLNDFRTFNKIFSINVAIDSIRISVKKLF